MLLKLGERKDIARILGPGFIALQVRDLQASYESELNRAARELFEAFMAPEQPALWSFQFLKGNDVMLRVDDRTVGFFFLEEGEVADLLAQGVSIDGEHLEEVDIFSAEASQSDIEVG